MSEEGPAKDPAAARINAKTGRWLNRTVLGIGLASLCSDCVTGGIAITALAPSPSAC